MRGLPWPAGEEVPSPPTVHNFEVPPRVGEVYNFEDFEYDPKAQAWFRKPTTDKAIMA